MADRNYVTTPEAWASFRKASKAAPAELSPDTVLAKPLNTKVAGVMKSRDDVAKFLANAPAEVKDEAMEALDPANLGDANAGAVVAFDVSDAIADRDDDTVSLDGWDLKEHKRNPVVLWSHDHRRPAIGNGLGTHVDAVAKALKSIGYFNDKDVDDFGFMIGRMFARRILRAVSVGFIAKLLAFNNERGDWAIDFLKQELIEWSGCNVGCNRNALSEARSIGIDTEPMLLEAVKTLEGEGGLYLPRAELEGIYRDLSTAKVITLGDLGAFRASKAGIGEGVREALKLAAAAPAPAPAPSPSPSPSPAAAALPGGVESKASGDVVDWKGVAVTLSKGIDPVVAARAVRANTFDKTEGAKVLADRKGVDDAGDALILAAPVKAAETPPSAPPAAVLPTVGIDPSKGAGENPLTNGEAFAADDLKGLTGLIEDRFNDLATELTGRLL